MIEAMHDAVLTSMNGTQNLTIGENSNSWTSVFDSRELVTELMAPFNEHTQAHRHTDTSWAKLGENYLNFSLYLF